MNWLRRKLFNRSANHMIKKALTGDRKSTIVGAALSGLQFANVDYAKLLDGNGAEIGKVVGAIVTALLGWYANSAPEPSENPEHQK